MGYPKRKVLIKWSSKFAYAIGLYWPNSFRYYSSFCSGSLKFIKWLRRCITKHAGIKGFLEITDRICALKYGKAETNVLFQKMFPGYSVPCLKRKADKARHIFLMEKEHTSMKKITSRGGEIGKHATFRA